MGVTISGLFTCLTVLQCQLEAAAWVSYNRVDGLSSTGSSPQASTFFLLFDLNSGIQYCWCNYCATGMWTGEIQNALWYPRDMSMRPNLATGYLGRSHRHYTFNALVTQQTLADTRCWISYFVHALQRQRWKSCTKISLAYSSSLLIDAWNSTLPWSSSLLLFLHAASNFIYWLGWL